MIAAIVSELDSPYARACERFLSCIMFYAFDRISEATYVQRSYIAGDIFANCTVGAVRSNVSRQRPRGQICNLSPCWHSKCLSCASGPAALQRHACPARPTATSRRRWTLSRRWLSTHRISPVALPCCVPDMVRTHALRKVATVLTMSKRYFRCKKTGRRQQSALKRHRNCHGIGSCACSMLRRSAMQPTTSRL